ncbi:hypothetical protein IEO21_11127 [Rhodonia placenta]|uniref:Uncharacterized protein n=1 Tax=Rhodonia placenta TaxID=104341 RepID=A0A8H7NRA5_9APHY|nr:hypothetical protein IEO21_11127 [Postia placenta]
MVVSAVLTCQYMRNWREEELQNLLVNGGRCGHYRRRGGRRTARGRRQWLWLSAGRTSRGTRARAASRRRWR